MTPSAAQFRPLVVDCETRNATEEETRQWIGKWWKPDARWTPETVEKRRAEALEKALEKRALLPTAPIISITIKSGPIFFCLHTMPMKKLSKRLERLAGEHRAEIAGFQDESKMLGKLATILASSDMASLKFVGHNVKGFDLPKVRGAMARYGVRLPAVLDPQGHQPIFDTMFEFPKFCPGADGYVGLEAACGYFGISTHKGVMSGKDVPELYEAGEYEAILMYALLDVLDEEALYARMTAQ